MSKVKVKIWMVMVELLIHKRIIAEFLINLATSGSILEVVFYFIGLICSWISKERG